MGTHKGGSSLLLLSRAASTWHCVYIVQVMAEEDKDDAVGFRTYIQGTGIRPEDFVVMKVG